MVRMDDAGVVLCRDVGAGVAFAGLGRAFFGDDAEIFEEGVVGA